MIAAVKPRRKAKQTPYIGQWPMSTAESNPLHRPVAYEHSRIIDRRCEAKEQSQADPLHRPVAYEHSRIIAAA